MELLQKLLHLIREPGQLIIWGGYPALALIIFLETGAMVFFLPGDSLLVTAGLYAAKGDLSIWILNALLIPLAILGDAVSYTIGSRGGAMLFKDPNARLLKPQYLKKAQEFYDRHGGKAIIIARFVPIVRTFVPVVAGAAKMPYRRFGMFNVIGAASWILSMTMIGFLLGNVVPNIDKHIEKVIVGVVFVSLLPGLIEYLRARSAAKRATGSTIK